MVVQAIKADSLNADTAVSAFQSQEEKIVSKWQRQSKLHLTNFIASAVEGSLRGMMAQWLPGDKTKIVALYNKVCGAQLSATAMKAIISKDVNAMLRELNAHRKAFAASHPQLATKKGLKDTVRAYEACSGVGNGFSFANYNAGDMCHVICEAIDLYHNDKKAYRLLQTRGMTGDFSWTRSAQAYHDIYQSICSK